jgi:hypothetical protein
MDVETWAQAMASMVEVVQATKPDLVKLVSYPKERYFRGSAAPDGESLIILFENNWKMFSKLVTAMVDTVNVAAVLGNGLSPRKWQGEDHL